MPEVKNHFSIERLSLRYRYFVFLDTGEYLADRLFIKHRVTVKFMQEYGRDDLPYLVIFCRIKKQDEGAFFEALNELPNKMLLRGYPDYPVHCRDIIEKIADRKSNERKCSHGADDSAAKAEQT